MEKLPTRRADETNGEWNWDNEEPDRNKKDEIYIV